MPEHGQFYRHSSGVPWRKQVLSVEHTMILLSGEDVLVLRNEFRWLVLDFGLDFFQVLLRESVFVLDQQLLQLFCLFTLATVNNFVYLVENEFPSIRVFIRRLVDLCNVRGVKLALLS